MQMIRALLLILASFPALQSLCAAAGEYIVYVGPYTNGSSKGIYAWKFAPAAAKLTPLGLMAASENPSFLALHPSGKYLYAVNEVSSGEGKAGAVSAFSVNPATGALTFLNKVSSRGADPCHLAVDRTGKFVLVANYSGGNVAVFPIKSDGSLGAATAFIQHHGSGPDKSRQDGPRAHSVVMSADNRFAVVSDLGLDELLVYRFDATKGTLTPNDPPFAKLDPAVGPRHFAFHPNGKFGYSINEMGSNVTALAYDPGRGAFTKLQSVSTLPGDFKGENTTAEVVVDRTGTFLYGSNRGHDSIAVFSIDAAKGTLTPVERFPTKGKEPRNFALDPTGAYLFAANQNSGNVVLFRVDRKTGRLAATDQVLSVDAPVCVVFLPVK